MEGSYFKHKARSKKIGTIIGWIILGAIAMVGFAFLFGYVVMLLWNWIMPEIFGLAVIGFWKAVGIIILAKLLFGGFGGHSKSSRHDRDKCKDDSNKKKSFKNGFSKWKYYEKFWEEKGDEAYKDYVKEKTEDAEYKDVTKSEFEGGNTEEQSDINERTDF